MAVGFKGKHRCGGEKAHMRVNSKVKGELIHGTKNGKKGDQKLQKCIAFTKEKEQTHFVVIP